MLILPNVPENWRNALVAPIGTTTQIIFPACINTENLDPAATRHLGSIELSHTITFV